MRRPERGVRAALTFPGWKPGTSLFCQPRGSCIFLLRRCSAAVFYLWSGSC